MKTRAYFLFALVGITCAVADQPTPPPTNSSDYLGPELRSACWKGDLPTVTSLLDAGAPLENRDPYGRTPLFLACHGDTDVVRLLLARGAKADVVDGESDTTVGRACEYGDLASAKMVLAAGADLGHVNKEGRTPLMMAAREGHDDVVAWLIQQKVDVNYHKTNDPALSYAVWRDHLSTAKLLLAAGARVDIGTEPNLINTHPRGILALAALTNDSFMIDLLLAHGAQINERDTFGFTPLLKAAEAAKPETVALLVNSGADLNLANNDGETPLMAAAENQPVETVRLFLQRGAHVDDRDHDGRTALIHTAMIGADEWTRELVSDHADVNVADNQGETALTYAGDRGNMRIVLFLEASGAKRTDLHIIPKPAANPPLSPARRWALAVGALYAQHNARSHARLAEPDSSSLAQRVLRDEWAITDRASLLARVSALMRPPTLTGTLAGQIADSLGRTTLEDKEVRAFQLLFFDSWWLGKTNVAWKLCRATNLLRNGVEAGYIPENDAWPILMAIARRTQSVFGSWREMSDNFLDAREIGANERSGNFRACARLLLDPKEANSPWNQLPWKTDLTGP